MRDLDFDPELLLKLVGLCLVCVFLGNLMRLLLSHEWYIATAALCGIVVGVLVYFDRLRRGAA